MKKFLLGLLLFFIVIVTVIIVWGIIASPQYSLKQLKKAISRNDLQAYDKYVDLDRTVDYAIDQTWQYFTGSASDNKKNPWQEIGNEIGYSLLSIAKPNLKEVIKKEVYGYITTGDLGRGNTKGEDGLSSLFFKKVTEKINPEDWEFKSINYVKRKEGMAFLGLTYYDQAKDANFIVEVKMRNMKGYWQIIEITNITQLLNIFYNIEIS